MADTVVLKASSQVDQAIEEMRRLQQENSTSLEKISESAQRTARTLDLTAVIAASALAVRGLTGAIGGAIETARRWDAAAVGVSEAQRRLERESRSLELGIGVLLVRAIDAGKDAVASLAENLTGPRSLAERVLDANDSVGRFVRQGLTLVVTGAEQAALALLSVTEEVSNLGNRWRMFSSEVEAEAADVAAAALAAFHPEFGISLEGQEALVDELQQQVDHLNDLAAASGAAADAQRALLGLPGLEATLQRERAELDEYTESWQTLTRNADEARREAASAAGDIGSGASTFEDMRQRVETAAAAMRNAIAQSYDVPDNPGLHGGAQTEAEAAGFRLIDVLDVINTAAHETRLALSGLFGESALEMQQQALAKGASAPIDPDKAKENELERIRNAAASLASKGGGIEPAVKGMEEAIAALTDSMVSTWSGGLESMFVTMGEFLGGSREAWEGWLKNLISGTGKAMAQLGFAFIAGGSAAGPLGIGLVSLGLGLSLIGGMLGSGGGGGGGATAAGPRAADVTPFAPEIQRGRQGNTYIVQAGMVFATRDAMRRGVADLVVEAEDLGEIQRRP